MICPACGADRPDSDEPCAACGALSQFEDLDTIAGDAPTPSTSRSPLLIGRVLAGRYELTDVVGEGGMGMVYRAKDSLLGEDVAVKLLHGQFLRNQQMVEEFKQEILTARRISHPRVVRIHDIGEDEGQFFISMELLTGGTLADWIRRRATRATMAEALPHAVAIAEGLAAVHGAGIVHHDVKPQNFLFDGNRAKVADFGLAQLASAERRREGLLGTPLYMCPEAWAEEEVGFAGDVYSLGAVLFELFTGRPPFQASSWIQLKAAHTKHVAPRARSLRDDLPEILDRAIFRALAKEPDDRYAHAGDLVQTLVMLADAADIPIEAGVPSSAFVRTKARNFSLPTPATVFIGREQELADVEEQFVQRGRRCVTILGPGGIGKTRIALHYASQIRPRYEGGVWFCDLTEAHSGEAACTAIARALSVPLTGGDAGGQLADALAGREPLLVLLDNAEHAAAELGPLLDTWLGAAPDLRVLVTSRVLTRAPAEVAYEVGPMSLPAKGSYSEAVNLFLERAEHIRPDHAFTTQNVDMIGQIVTRLEGMPLAIELAVARLRVLSLDDLFTRLETRLDVLSSSGRWSGDPRHATVRRTLDWSWDLLSLLEQAALAQCSVFRGGFTLAAAEAVLDVGEAPPLDILESLAEQSVLRADASEGRARFSLYELVREYAAEQLESRGETAPTEERHTAHYIETGEAWAKTAYTHGGIERIQHLVDERENIAAVHARALANGDPDTALRAALSLEPVAWTRGPIQPYANALTAALDANPTDEELTAWGLIRRARALRALGKGDASAADLERALEMTSEGSRGRAWALFTRGVGQDVYGMPTRARTDLQRAVDLARRNADARLEGNALNSLAIVNRRMGQLGSALGLYERAVELAEQAGDEQALGVFAGNLGMLQLDRGEDVQARQWLETALRLHRAVGNRRSEGYILGHLAAMEHEAGNTAGALETYGSAIGLLSAVGYRRAEATFQGYRGLLLHELGRLEDALYSHDRAIDLQQGESAPITALFHAGRGAVLASSNDIEAARSSFDQAESILREATDPVIESAVRVLKNHLSGAEGKSASLDESGAQANEIRFARRTFG